jgi:ABC-type sugar transport system, periplasmic component
VRRRARIMMTMAAALGLTVGVSGCGTDSGSGAKTTTLTVVATNYGDSVHKNSIGFWDRVGLAFQAAHPDIRVETKVYPADEVDAKVAALVKQGRAPDVVQTDSYAEYAAKGMLYRADELLSISAQGSFVPSLAQAGQVRRVQYGLPFTASTRLLYYNKDLFSRAGLKPPTTWQQLLVEARVLKAMGVTYPIALPLGPEEAEAETLTWLLAGAAATPTTAAATPSPRRRTSPR